MSGGQKARKRSETSRERQITSAKVRRQKWKLTAEKSRKKKRTIKGNREAQEGRSKPKFSGEIHGGKHAKITWGRKKPKNEGKLKNL